MGGCTRCGVQPAEICSRLYFSSLVTLSAFVGNSHKDSVRGNHRLERLEQRDHPSLATRAQYHLRI